MAAESKKQRRLTAIAEHHPEKLYARNRGVLKMGKEELHKFASTEEKGLPEKKRKVGKGRRLKRKLKRKARSVGKATHAGLRGLMRPKY